MINNCCLFYLYVTLCIAATIFWVNFHSCNINISKNANQTLCIKVNKERKDKLQHIVWDININVTKNRNLNAIDAVRDINVHVTNPVSAIMNMDTTRMKKHNQLSTLWDYSWLDLLQKEPYKFLRELKNPCWYEPLRTIPVYNKKKRNWFSVQFVKTMTKIWQKRLKEEHPRRLRCMPYFFLIGQSKCGSTDLFHRICSHPDVVAPTVKEPHWWNRNRIGKENGINRIPMSDYLDVFDEAALKIEKRGDNSSTQLITGEGSVTTMWDNDLWWHLRENAGLAEPYYTNCHYIKHFLPHLKILVILREPSDRLFSDYLFFNQSEKKSQEDFHNRVKTSIHLYKKCFRIHSIRQCLHNTSLALMSQVRLRVGVYSEYYKDLLKCYSDSQILVLIMEEYSENIIHTMERVYEFLQLRKLSKSELLQIKMQKQKNKRRVEDTMITQMLNKTKTLLKAFYRAFVMELREILGKDRLWI